MLSGGALTSRAFFVVAPSHCQGCHQPLQLYELIPVVSIFLQRFRCRKCQQPVAFSRSVSLTASCFSAGLTIDALILWWWLTSAFTLSLIDYWYLVVEPKILYPSFCALLAESGGSAFVLLTDWSFCFVFPSRLTLFSGSHGARDLCYWVCGAVLQVPQLLMLLFLPVVMANLWLQL